MENGLHMNGIGASFVHVYYSSAVRAGVRVSLRLTILSLMRAKASQLFHAK